MVNPPIFFSRRSHVMIKYTKKMPTHQGRKNALAIILDNSLPLK